MALDGVSSGRAARLSSGMAPTRSVECPTRPGGVRRRRRPVERVEVIGEGPIGVIGGGADQIRRRRSSVGGARLTPQLPVLAARLLTEAAHAHVLDHALAQRTAGTV